MTPLLSPIQPASPDSPIVSLAPKLYRYDKGVGTNANTAQNPCPYVSINDFVQADAGELQITVPPERVAGLTEYKIKNFHEHLPYLSTLSATVTETPLLYVVRLAFDWPEEQPQPNYQMNVDLMDKTGEPMAFLSHVCLSRKAANGSGDVDFRLESIYPKQDGRTPDVLMLESMSDEFVCSPRRDQMGAAGGRKQHGSAAMTGIRNVDF